MYDNNATIFLSNYRVTSKREFLAWISRFIQNLSWLVKVCFTVSMLFCAISVFDGRNSRYNKPNIKLRLEHVTLSKMEILKVSE